MPSAQPFRTAKRFGVDDLIEVGEELADRRERLLFAGDDPLDCPPALVNVLAAEFLLGQVGPGRALD